MGRLRIHVHPGARRTAVRGWREDGALRLEVAAPPADGRANQAVERLLAETLGVPSRQVSVLRGQTSRAKTVEVEGMAEDEIRRRIEARCLREDERGE